MELKLGYGGGGARLFAVFKFGPNLSTSMELFIATKLV